MASFVVSMVIGMAVLAALLRFAATGLRNGDQPADATVSAVLRDAGQPDEPRPVVVATVHNPTGTPVLAGLSVRRAIVPAWVSGGREVVVPRRTARRRFRADGYATVGAVPAAATVRFAVPVETVARRYLLTVAVGQAGGRLRLHRLHVAGVRATARTALTVPSGEGRRD